MKVNFKELKDKSMFYEVIHENEVLSIDVPKNIMKEFKFTDSDWNKLHARKQSVDGMSIRPYGRMRLLFKHKNFIGTKDEIRDEFDYKDYVVKNGQITLEKVGYFFDCDADNRIIVEEEPESETVKPIEKKIESPNQKYIDSLFANCFKGWRA